MDSTALKLVLTPLLIGTASLVGRRWGPAVSGWLVGIPFTSGPISFFLAVSYGTTFAAAVAAGTLSGTLSQIAFCLTYIWLAKRWRWQWTLFASTVLFFVITALLQFFPLPLLPLSVVILLTLITALYLVSRQPQQASSISHPLPPWDIPLRMFIATSYVLLLTAFASVLGPHLTGLLSPFPMYATILALFAHRLAGPAAASQVLRGLLYGLFAFSGFFLTLALLLEPIGIVGAFAMAVVIVLAIQAISLSVLRR